MNKLKLKIYILTLILALSFSPAALALTYEGTIGGGSEGTIGTPDAPTNLTASAESTSQINLTWSAVSGVDGYELYKDGSLLTTTSDTSYSDTGLTASTAYSYKIRSYLGSVKSEFSAVVSATTEDEPQAPAPNPPSGGGGGGGGTYTPPAPTSVSSSNNPLTVSSTQAGELDYSFTDSSAVEVEIPAGAVSSNTTFSVSQGTLTSEQAPLETTGAFMIGDKVFNISAVNTSGVDVTNFTENLSITFTIPDMPSNTSDLAIYYFSELTGNWVLISGAVFDTSAKTVSFTVNHLTNFAVFQAEGAPASLTTSVVPEEPVEGTVGDEGGEVLGTKISNDADAFIVAEKELLTTIDKKLTARVSGKILLQVENHGEAWYVDPITDKRYYLPDGASAYEALRKFGLGISNTDLAKIPVGIEERFEDIDTDGDGLADKLEEGLGTDINNADTDGDGFTDYEEIMNQATNPLGAGNIYYNTSLINRLLGRIVLQVESRGEAWYINPADGRRYYMKDGDAAYQIMRFLSLGITNENIRKIDIGEL